jgi:hypothetical protein
MAFKLMVCTSNEIYFDLNLEPSALCTDNRRLYGIGGCTARLYPPVFLLNKYRLKSTIHTIGDPFMKPRSSPTVRRPARTM